MDSYKALCNLELGNLNEALQTAQVALKNFDTLPQSPYKEFSMKTYETIKGKVNQNHSL